MTIAQLPTDLLLYINEYSDLQGQVGLAVCSKNMTMDLFSYSSSLATRLSHYHAQRPFYKELCCNFPGLGRWFSINRAGYMWITAGCSLPPSQRAYRHHRPIINWTTSIGNVFKIIHNDNSKIVNIYYIDEEQDIIIKPIVFNSINDARMTMIRFGENVWSRYISSAKIELQRL